MTAPRPGQVGSAGGHGPAAVAEVAADRSRPSLVGFAVWAVLTGVAAALDGWTGVAVGVFAMAVVLARLPRRVIGGAGVLALLAAPVLVMVDGVPSMADVSPEFVTRSLWPHHAVFAGLCLVGTYVVLDLLDHLRHAASAPLPAERIAPLGRLGRRLRVALFVVVAVAALVAIVGVWTR